MNIKERLQAVQSRTNNFYQENKNKVLYIGIALLIAMGSVVYWFNFYLPDQEKEASTKFSKIYHYFKTDSFDIVLKGDKTKRISSAVDIADNYSYTTKGKEAALIVGLSYMKKNEFKKALDYLKNFNAAGDAFLEPAVMGAKATCYSGLGETEKAAGLFEEAAELGDNEFTSSSYYKKAAIHFEMAKDYSSALKCYQILESKYSSTQDGSDAEKFIYRLKGLLGDLNE